MCYPLLQRAYPAIVIEVLEIMFMVVAEGVGQLYAIQKTIVIKVMNPADRDVTWRRNSLHLAYW